MHRLQRVCAHGRADFRAFGLALFCPKQNGRYVLQNTNAVSGGSVTWKRAEHESVRYGVVNLSDFLSSRANAAISCQNKGSALTFQVAMTWI